MKKFFLILTSTIVLAFIATLLLAFNSSIQTNLINKIVPELSVKKVSIGLSNATLENIEYGKLAKVERIDASYSLFDVLLGEINVSSLKIKNAKVDTTALPKSDTKEEKPTVSINTSKKKFELPYALKLGSLEGNINVDSKDFKVIAKSIKAKPNLKFESGLIEIITDDATLKATADSSKELLLIKAILETGDKKPIQLSANIPHDYSEISTQVRIDTNETLIAKFIPEKFVLPKFTTALYADIKASVDFQKVSVNFIGDAKISELFKLNPTLKPINDCAFNIKVDLNKNGEKIEIKSFDANLSESGTAIANITAKPFVANTASELENAEIVTIISIPTRIIEDFVPNLKINSDNICTKLSAKKKGENYQITTLSPVSLTNATIEKSGEKLLQNANIFADIDATVGKKTDANIVLRMADSKTSQFSISSKIVYENNQANIDILGEGSLNPIISRLHSMSSVQLLGLNFSLNSKLNYGDDKISIDKFETIIKDSNGTNITNISTKSAILYDIKNTAITTASNDIISIDAQSFPIALIKPFVPELDAEKASFAITVSTKNQKDFFADITTSINSLSYKKDGKYLAQNLSVSLTAKANYNQGLATVDILKGTLANGTNLFCTLDASAEYDIKNKSLKSAKTKLTTSLPQILDQPALQKFSNIARGNADVNASYNGKDVQAKIDVHSLLTRTSPNLLDTINANISSDLKSVSATLVVKSTRGESDTQIKLDNTENLYFDFIAKSLVLEDIITLAGAFSNPNYIEENGKVKQPEKGRSQRIIKPNLATLQPKDDSIAKPDKKAFWDIDKNISINAKIEKLFSKGSLILEKFNTGLTATSNNLNLSKFNGILMSANLSGSALLTFDSTKKTPYELKTTSFRCEDFDASKIFADKENPMLTGIFDANLKLNGSGYNAEHLLKYLCGEAEITSDKSGVIRLLDKNSLTGRTTNLAGNIFKLTGKLLNNKVKELSGIGDLITLFSKIDYKTAQIKLSRNSTDYNYNFDLIELKTDSLILSSESGKIFFDPYAQSFGEQKMNIPIVIYALGSSKTLLEQIGYAKKQNKNGYYEGPTFLIGGTVSKPSTNLLEIITSTKNAVGNVLEKINFFKK